MVRRPEFLTFTGVDERTDLAKLRALSRRWPGRVEFAILLSLSRMGREPRYPDRATVQRFVFNLPRGECRRAAHLCGTWAAEALLGERLDDLPIVTLAHLDRVQINHQDDPLAAAGAERFGARNGVRAVLQSRDKRAFPESTAVDWLYDCSGGHGIWSVAWPVHAGPALNGFAGGLELGNIGRAIELIDARGPYWLDMESGVRTDDWFDLEKVEAICSKVFGEGQ